MRPLALNLVPWEFWERSGILLNIQENLNLAFLKKAFSSQDRQSVFSYWTITYKLEFIDWSIWSNGCSVLEKLRFSDRGWLLPPPLPRELGFKKKFIRTQHLLAFKIYSAFSVRSAEFLRFSFYGSLQYILFEFLVSCASSSR